MKTSEIVKAEDLNQSSLTDDSFSVINLHAPSGVGGATVVLLVLSQGLVGYGVAKWLQRRKNAARRTATSLEIMKNPA